MFVISFLFLSHFSDLSTQEPSTVTPSKRERDSVLEESDNAFANFNSEDKTNTLISIVKPFVDGRTERRHVVALLLLPSGTTEVAFDIPSDKSTTLTFSVIVTISNEFTNIHKLLSKLVSGVSNIDPMVVALKEGFRNFRYNI